MTQSEHSPLLDFVDSTGHPVYTAPGDGDCYNADGDGQGCGDSSGNEDGLSGGGGYADGYGGPLGIWSDQNINEELQRRGLP